MEGQSFPVGTVTFLFTDIEGSTRLLHSLGDEYALALADQRLILRLAFEQYNGCEIDTQALLDATGAPRGSNKRRAIRCTSKIKKLDSRH